MLALLDLVPRWIWLAIIAALSATSCKLKLENGQLSIEVEKHATHIAQLETSIQSTSRQAVEQAANMERQAREAEKSAAVRTAALRRDADSARSELDRLRVALSDYTRPRLTSAATLAPGLDVTDKLPELFLSCTARYADVARDADIWKSDAIKLLDAWPKGQ